MINSLYVQFMCVYSNTVDFFKHCSITVAVRALSSASLYMHDVGCNHVISSSHLYAL